MSKAGFLFSAAFCIALSMNVLDCRAQQEGQMDCDGNQIVFKQCDSQGREAGQTTLSLPEYPDGLDALYDHLDTALVYPEALKPVKAEGTATVQFIVGADGEISEVSIATSSGYPEMDDEAVRVVKGFPSWTPAKKNGSAISMRTQMPITFIYYEEE